MQEFLSATSGIDEMLRMLNDYLIFDLREQYSQVRFRDEKNLVQVMKDLTYDNEKENVSIPNREVSQEYINAISRFPFCNTTMKTRCIIILGSCVFRVIWVYTIFAYFHTITSLYLLYIFSWRITSAAEILYFRHDYKTLQISQK